MRGSGRTSRFKLNHVRLPSARPSRRDHMTLRQPSLDRSRTCSQSPACHLRRPTAFASSLHSLFWSYVLFLIISFSNTSLVSGFFYPVMPTSVESEHTAKLEAARALQTTLENTQFHLVNYREQFDSQGKLSDGDVAELFQGHPGLTDPALVGVHLTSQVVRRRAEPYSTCLI